MNLKDTDKMMFGKYEGTPLIDVPADYLLWIYTNLSRLRGDLRTYIEDNMEALKKEVADKNK